MNSVWVAGLWSRGGHAWICGYVINKAMIADTWAWRDQPTDQVGPILTSCLHEIRTEVVHTRLQISTMTQPPWSHNRVAPHGKHGASYEEWSGYWPFSNRMFTYAPRWGSQGCQGIVNDVVLSINNPDNRLKHYYYYFVLFFFFFLLLLLLFFFLLLLLIGLLSLLQRLRDKVGFFRRLFICIK